MPESTKGKIVENVVLSVALVLCVASSIWICYGQVEKYFMEMTLINNEYVKEDKFPNLLFCPSEGKSQLVSILVLPIDRVTGVTASLLRATAEFYPK